MYTCIIDMHDEMKQKSLTVTLTDKTWDPWWVQLKSNAMRLPDVYYILQNNVMVNFDPRPFMVPVLSMDGEHLRGAPNEEHKDGELLMAIAPEWAAYSRFAPDAYRNYLKELSIRKNRLRSDLGVTFDNIRVTSSQQIWDRMKRMPQFAAKYAAQDLLFIVESARAASTGTGAHSVYIDFC